MAYEKVANVRGPVGPRGPRGLPGFEGVPTDEGVATLVGAEDSQTGIATQDRIDASIDPGVAGLLTPNSTASAALQLEAYLNESYSGAPRTPGNVWSGYLMGPRWKAGVRRVLDGSGVAKVLCLGDSTTAGIGSSGSYANESAWPSAMGRMLHRNVASTVWGLSIPPSSDQADSDPRWVLGPGWAHSTETGVGLGDRKTVYKAGPGSGPLTFADPRIDADRYDIYYVTNGSASAAGTLTAQIGSGTPVVVNTNEASSIKKVTVSAAAPSSAPVSITNTGATGNVWIIGVEPWQSGAVNRIRVGNAGASGSGTQGWLQKASGSSDAWNVIAFLAAYQPDLTIIDLGINDANASVATATYLSRMQTLADACYAAGSAVLLKTMIPSSGSRAPIEAEYVAALTGQMSPRHAVLDLFTHYGSWERNNARGWMADWGHGTDAIYADEGALVAEMLFRYSGHGG